MPRPKRTARHETGQSRNTSRVRRQELVRSKPRTPRPNTVQVIEYRPPLDNPVSLGIEQIWPEPRARDFHLP